jgi:hypothetical protein
VVLCPTKTPHPLLGKNIDKTPQLWEEREKYGKARDRIIATIRGYFRLFLHLIFHPDEELPPKTPKTRSTSKKGNNKVEIQSPSVVPPTILQAQFDAAAIAESGDNNAVVAVSEAEEELDEEEEPLFLGVPVGSDAVIHGVHHVVVAIPEKDGEQFDEVEVEEEKKDSEICPVVSSDCLDISISWKDKNGDDADFPSRVPAVVSFDSYFNEENHRAALNVEQGSADSDSEDTEQNESSVFDRSCEEISHHDEEEALLQRPEVKNLVAEVDNSLSTTLSILNIQEAQSAVPTICCYSSTQDAANKDEDDEDDECFICLMPLLDEEQFKNIKMMKKRKEKMKPYQCKKLACGKKFHLGCFEDWQKVNDKNRVAFRCPYCKHPCGVCFGLDDDNE